MLVQDYHFALAPRFIREALPRAVIISFWHIPWPNAERFGICPWRTEILEGLLGSSIIGFHTPASLQQLPRLGGTLPRIADRPRRHCGRPARPPDLGRGHTRSPSNGPTAGQPRRLPWPSVASVFVPSSAFPRARCSQWAWTDSTTPRGSRNVFWQSSGFWNDGQTSSGASASRSSQRPAVR